MLRFKKTKKFNYKKLLTDLTDESNTTIESLLGLRQIFTKPSWFEKIYKIISENRTIISMFSNASSKNDFYSDLGIENLVSDEIKNEDYITQLEEKNNNIDTYLQLIELEHKELSSSYRELLDKYIQLLDDTNTDLNKYFHLIDDATWKSFVRKRKIDNIINKD